MSVVGRMIAVGLLALGMTALAQQPTLTTREPADLSIAMRAKLGASQRLVEGLTAGNFDLIRKGAEELKNICESQVWRPREDQVYSHYRGELHRAAIKLAELAEQQNLDGAAYTYMHTLTTCINCHQYSRDVLRVAAVQRNAAVISIPVTEAPTDVYRRALVR
ncbi:MAG: hypothetical protein KF752_16540 [Pirellulaceae bacterium]|nr:hypothetical protein [Pirellulaceae bacterium]